MVFFYIVVGYIGIIILLSIIVSYTATYSKHFGWPLPFLRFNFLLLNTIFFMPGLEVLMAMYMCDQDNSNVHAVFTTVTCWKDMHIIHACVGIIFILFFLGFCILSTLTCFEGRWVFKKLFFSLILIKFFHQNSTILKNYWF